MMFVVGLSSFFIGQARRWSTSRGENLVKICVGSVRTRVGGLRTR